MGLMRSVLLAGSQSSRLRSWATRHAFVQRSVSRFMPGERAEQALDAARQLNADGIGAILTHLGENVRDAAEATAVTKHYLDLLDRVSSLGLDAQVSVKLTQLGLDLDSEQCYRNLCSLAERALGLGNFVWIDMEGTGYVDSTLAIFIRTLSVFRNVGVCVQAYLFRTAADVEALTTRGAAIRLVKGAYREPPSLAFPRKQDVDKNFLTLAQRLLNEESRRAGVKVGIATHDTRLIERLEELIEAQGIPRESYEFEMLYGIRRDEQLRLARKKRPVRVLVSYGEYWFPWYMRRLAERPANVLFVLKNLLSG